VNNISYSEKWSVASNVSDIIVNSTCFGTDFDQMNVIGFSQGTVTTFYS